MSLFILIVLIVSALVLVSVLPTIAIVKFDFSITSFGAKFPLRPTEIIRHKPLSSSSQT